MNSESTVGDGSSDAVNGPVDSNICSRVLMEDLDAGTVREYRNVMSSRQPDHPWLEVTDDELLQLIGAAAPDGSGILRPTVAGVLMFGRDYSIERELPRYILDYLEYEGCGPDWSYRVTTDAGDWPGNLFQFYMRVINRLNLRSKHPFRIQDGVRIDDSNQLKTYREAVLNALIHADYDGSGGIRIELRDSSLTVRNPGTFSISLRLAQSGCFSDPRNPIIMKMFMLIGFSKRAGSGLRHMTALCRALGINEPSVVECQEPPTVTVAIGMDGGTGVEVAGADLNAMILECMRRDGRISIAEIAEKTGSSTSSVSRRIKVLKEEGRLIREGSRAGGRWEVIRR